MKLSNIVKIWDILNTKDTGELGLCHLADAIDEVVGTQNDLPKTQPIMIDGKSKDPARCPTSDGRICPKDGTELKSSYGLSGDYGIGVYNCCPKCYEIYDFVEDSPEGLDDY